MTETVNLANAFPTKDYTWYGRSAAHFGEDTDGIIVAGHDRRSWAALRAACRDYDSSVLEDMVPARDVSVHWATFSTGCGCTEEQHALHGTEPPEGEDPDDDRHSDCYEHCATHGLPPCSDQWGWVMHSTGQPTPGAVPILEYRW